ncbi:MAG: AbgT family transporter [Saprospiraceae bacterium]|nr:AbgT family transporter [Saprospiraceae bacterium]MDW8485153.1 AbgT family transporter [Saprospiraceae bacterium]
MNTASNNWVNRFLAVVERAGNALPHPATLFVLFAVFIILLSGLLSWFDVSVLHPGTQKEVRVVNLLSTAGLHRILTDMVKNFTGFAPLGTVLVALLGIGIAEGSGLIGTALRWIVLKSPARLLTFVVVFAGVMSNTASEVGYVLLVPLSAVIFLAAKRHPIAGVAAAFAGVSGGYSANLLLGTVDPLLAGLSEEAARIVQPDYKVNPACNYYFMAASAPLIAVLGTWVTEHIVEPRLGAYVGEGKAEDVKPLSASERRGLRFALAAAGLFVAFLLAGLLPADGYLRDPKTGDVLHSPFMSGIVALLFLGAAITGIAYGIGAGSLRTDADVMKSMAKSMETLGAYIVLVFFAAQFVAYFNWTNLGLILAVKGAETLKASGLGPIPLTMAFVLLTATVNLVMGSASAKWAIMAPVFVPMFMLLGYSPEFTQAAYRVGDSVTNIISPMMSYFALIVALIQRYEPRAGIGTLVATMLPYTFVFILGWTLLLVIWIVLDLPLGFGAEIRLESVFATPHK